jgi:DNA modification methylase
MNTGFDLEKLEAELKALEGFEFDMKDFGFDFAEEMKEIKDDGFDIEEALENVKSIVQLGDIWQLGRHRLMCGDSTNSEDVSKLMAGKLADMVFTDPPYNLRITKISKEGLNKYGHKDFINAGGEMSSEEFSNFLRKAMENLVAHSKENSIHYICMDWRHIYELLVPAKKLYKKHKNMCVWNKDNIGLGKFYTNKHELIFVFQNGDGQYTCNFKFGERTNVWDYPSIVSFANNKPKILENGKWGIGENEEVKMHPTVKPLQLVADAIKDCSYENELILDLFGGSGTTLIASEQTNRVAYLMELDPKYCDVIIARWEKLTGEKAEKLI